MIQTYSDHYIFFPCNMFFLFVKKKKKYFPEFHKYNRTSKQMLTFQKYRNTSSFALLMFLVLKNIISYSGLGSSVTYTQYCCCWKEYETKWKTKEAEFKRRIKIPFIGCCLCFSCFHWFHVLVAYQVYVWAMISWERWCLNSDESYRSDWGHGQTHLFSQVLWDELIKSYADR